MQTDVLNVDELHSAFMIDEHGNEIRITRDMIDQCCEAVAVSEHPSNQARQAMLA